MNWTQNLRTFVTGSSYFFDQKETYTFSKSKKWTSGMKWVEQTFLCKNRLRVEPFQILSVETFWISSVNPFWILIVEPFWIFNVKIFSILSVKPLSILLVEPFFKPYSIQYSWTKKVYMHPQYFLFSKRTWDLYIHFNIR